MKIHFKIFLVSAALVILSGVLSGRLDLLLSEALIVQAQSISYFFTLAGVVFAFSWYNRTATPVKEGVYALEANLKKQNRILYYLLCINVINAGVLLINTTQPVQLMTAISLLVVLISPMIFRTMQEKINDSVKTEDTAENTN